MNTSSKCQNCKGKGILLIEQKNKCLKCHGLGSTKLVLGGASSSSKNACPDCKGTGQIIKKIEKICRECDGKGVKKNNCVLCDKPANAGNQFCENCVTNPIVYQLIFPVSTKTVEFNKVYKSKVIKKTNFGYFVELAPKIEGLVRDQGFLGNEGTQLFVKLKNTKGDKLEFERIEISAEEKLFTKRIHDPVPLQKIRKERKVGTFFSILAEVENIRQIPRGPKIFTLLDETGIIEAAAFHLENIVDNIKIGNIVEVTGEYTLHQGSEQIEVSDIFIVDEAYANAFKRKMDELLDKKSQPPEIDFLIKSETLSILKPKFLDVAKRIRRAILELQPIMIRHHADADGITAGIALEVALRDLWFQIYDHFDDDQLRHIVKRTVNKPPFYDPLDAVKDLNFALEDQERFGDKIPLILMVDTGSSDESSFSYKIMKTYGIEIIVIDHHFPSGNIQDTIDIHLNVYFSGGDYNICSGMLGTELARFINPKVSDIIDHLPAIAGMGDRVEGTEFKQYLALAEKKGYMEDFLNDIAIAVDYQAYFLKFSPGRLLLEDLLGLGGKQEKQINFVKLLTTEAQKLLENQLRISLEYVQEDRLPNGIHLAVLDVENYANRFDYPPPGKITGSLFDHLAEKDRNLPLVTIGLGPDFAIFRSQNVKLDFPNLVKICSQKLPHAGVEGGGHEIVGSMKFISGARGEITTLIRELLTLIEIVTEEE